MNDNVTSPVNDVIEKKNDHCISPSDNEHKDITKNVPTKDEDEQEVTNIKDIPSKPDNVINKEEDKPNEGKNRKQGGYYGKNKYSACKSL